MFNCKKLMSLALAGVMAASLAVPAFAAEETESTTNTKLTISGTYQAVTVAVVVPTTGEVVINPYALPVEIGKDASDKAVEVEKQQIVTKPLAIKNQSKVDLDVNVTATATVKGALTLATAAIEKPAEDTKNDAFVYLAFADSALSGDNDTVTTGAITEAYAKVEWPAYVATGDGSESVLVLKTSAQTKAGMATLKASTFDEDSGEWKAYAEGSISYLGLTGQCAQNPKTAWTAKDGLSATIAFTFTPNVTE
jgi:hypothetical protein